MCPLYLWKMESFRKTFSWILFPLTIWYGIGMWLRNLLFDLGVLPQRTFKATTISVGNLACGGTGKTPHVEYLIRLLSKDYLTAFVSRGYMRQTKGLVVDDGSHDYTQLGDEPSMVAAKFPDVAVAVSEKRAVALDYLLSQSEPPQLVLLDDAYQHRYVKPHLNILLTDYNHLYNADHVLPFGNLREFRSGRNRANIIIVTKTPQHIGPIERRGIVQSLKPYSYQKVFFSSIHYGDIYSLATGEKALLSDFSQVLMLTGIANPAPMLRYVKKSCKVTPLSFPDHHNFTEEDLEQIVSKFESLSSDRCIILTTEKDSVRLMHQNRLSQLPIYVLPIEVEISSNENYDFDEVVKSFVKENCSFQARL